MIVIERRCIELESCLILPIGQADPLQVKFVVAIERIRDESIAQQIGVNYSGNLRSVPLCDPGMVSRISRSFRPLEIAIRS